MSTYVCPMHADARAAGPGKCPHCKMNLVPEGAKLGILWHLTSSPWHIAAMAALMLAVMAAVMMAVH